MKASPSFPPFMARYQLPGRSSWTSVWWWSVDRWIVIGCILLMAMGTFMVMTAGPSVAHRCGYPPLHFAKKHFLFLSVACPCFFLTSCLRENSIRTLGFWLFAFSLAGMVASLFLGGHIKGASRWLPIMGFSLQPSEFLKPSFVILCAWLLSIPKKDPAFPGLALSFFLYVLCILVLFLQPDFGMGFLISVAFFAQVVLAGLSFIWILGGLGLAGAGVFAAFLFLPHVARRVEGFFSKNIDQWGEHYQISRSLESFARGKFWGVGPGEGEIKRVLPDAHTDFIFSVMGEEMGAGTCLLVLLVFMGLAARLLMHSVRAAREGNFFTLFALSGLMTQFVVQIFINTASALYLIPPKGMTLPFISYGGSSLVSSALMMGMALALTSKLKAGEVP